MEIKTMNVSRLVPYENNPRKNDRAVDAVAASIREFGFRVPIIIDKKNVIVAGHTRLKAAEKLGLKTVPVILADDLTEEQIKAFRLADNKVAELSKWDYAKLDEELDLIENINMEDFLLFAAKQFSDDDFFSEEKEEKEEKKTLVTCPCCGKSFEA